jgi:DNA primase
MSGKRFSDNELKEVRNEIPVRLVLERLCGLECKEVEGCTRFVCPVCHEMRTSLHPKENLGRCFRCDRNFNAIEFVMYGCKMSFVNSVKLLLAELGRLRLSLSYQQIAGSAGLSMVPPSRQSVDN